MADSKPDQATRQASAIDLDKFGVEIDGPLHPPELPADRALGFGGAVFRLLTELARIRNVDVQFIGVQVLDKCTAFVATPSDPTLAHGIAVEAHGILQGSVKAPHGLKVHVVAAKAAIKRLPEGHKPRLIAQGKVIDIQAPAPVIDKAPYSMESFRATPTRVGGTPPRIWFSGREDGKFGLRASKSLAKQVGGYIYDEIQIDATVRRLKNGQILDGELIEFHAVDSRPSIEVWREWRSANDELLVLPERDDYLDAEDGAEE